MQSKYMQNVLKHFYDISKVNRPSYHEEKIAQFIVDFFKQHSIGAEIYEANNILIRVPASLGYENKPTVCLQAHLDMVNIKAENVDHDWENEPIQSYIENGWLKAKGTSLGADNGWGMAMMMEIGTNPEIKHGPLELLFTSIEEPGLIGISKLPKNLLKAEFIINLDSEEWGSFYYRCFAGHFYRVKVPITYEEMINDNMFLVDIEVSNLRGGHSGGDIAKPRANAIKLLAVQVDKIIHEFSETRLVSFDGGTAANAIPIKATAIISLQKNHFEACKQMLWREQENYRKTFKDENKLTIEAKVSDSVYKFMFSPKTQIRILSSLLAVSSGLRYYDFDLNMPSCSNNLGVVKTFQNRIFFEVYTRGINDVMLDYIDDESMAVFKLASFEREDVAYYPAWSMDKSKNKFITITKNLFTKLYGITPEYKISPAGLECSFLSNYYPNASIISYGPNIRDVHTPSESLELDSASKCIDFTIELLNNIV